MTAHPLTRRGILRVLGASAVSILPSLVPAGCRKEKSNHPGKKPLHRVHIAPCPEYDPEGLLGAIRTGWQSTRPPNVRGKRVVIKPNIADFSENRPIHTEPLLVEALALHLRELGAGEIILAEGPPQNRDTEWLFRKSGFEGLSSALEIPLIDLNTDDIRPIRNARPKAGLLRDLLLPEVVLSADVLISVPKMKTHKLAGITLSMKNMFGIVPGMKYGWPKNILHWNGIPRSIVEICATVPTHYSIVDGVIGMEGHGPILGTARKAGVLVMGDSSLAVDATAARIMGIEPARVEYLAMAQAAHLGSLRIEDIELTGADIRNVRTDFALEPEYARLRASRE